MTRADLCNKYFSGLPAYGNGNLSLVTLLSDVQHGFSGDPEHYIEVLNDVKAVLINDHKKDGAKC